MKAIISPFFLLFFLYGSNISIAQTNLDKMLQQVEAGKTYALYKATKADSEVYTEENSFYIKVTPPIYKTVYDTIEITPALNGNLDTSNYFIQTEILVLKEASLAWKTARIHQLCREDKSTPVLALCLLKTTPEYQIVNRKFFPFKNILDTTTTDYIIPAEIEIVERKVLVQDTRIMRLTEDKKNQIAKGEKLVKISKGNWAAWTEVVCPYGEFNDPDIKEVQTALKKQNYNVKITGNFDATTREALHQFQKDNMLDIGGLSDGTLERLGIRKEPLISIDY